MLGRLVGFRVACLCLLGTLAHSHVRSQTFTPVDTRGYTHDVIVNGVGSAVSSADNDVDGVNNALVVNGWQLTSSSTPLTMGLPATGLIVIGDRTYQLQDYSKPNDLRLSQGTPSGALTLEAPANYGALSVLATGGSGASTVSMTVHFEDGSQTEVPPFSLADWYGGANYVISGLSRINLASNAVEQGGTNPRLYRQDVALSCVDQQKRITRLEISRVAPAVGGSVVNVFALSGARPDVLTSPAISGVDRIPVGLNGALSVASSGGVWSSDDPQIVTIDEAGNFAALLAGTTTIRYKAEPCSAESVHVMTVHAPEATSVQLIAPGTLAIGQPVDIAASVTSNHPGDPPPGGVIDIVLGVERCQITLLDGSGSCSLTPTEAGKGQTLLAFYGGALGFEPTQRTQLVDVLKQSVVVSMSASPTPPKVGEPVSFTVTVAASPPAVTLRSKAKAGQLPGGAVTFSDNGQALGTVPLMGGVAALSMPWPTEPGDHSIVASYSGDAHFEALQSAPFVLSVPEPAPPAKAEPVPTLGALALAVMALLIGISAALRITLRKAHPDA